MRRRPGPDAGFTLVELLVAMSVGGLVVAALGTAVLTTLLNYSASTTRMGLTHDAQLLQSWLGADVQSAGPGAGTVDMSPSTAATGCAGSVAPGSTNVLKTTWSDFDTGTTYAAAYRLEPNSGGASSSLVRYFCTPGTTGTPSRIVVGHYVTAASAVLSTNTVTMSVTSTLTGTSYSYSVSATRRTTTVPAPTTTLGHG